MLTVSVRRTRAGITRQTPLTTGLVGAAVEFLFDATWQGLTKTAVFRCGDVTRDGLLEKDRAIIPWEVLCQPGLPLEIGVFGCNGAGDLVIPTCWAATDPLLPGADPSGDPATDPSLPVWQQILGRLEGAVSSVPDYITAEADRVAEAVQSVRTAKTLVFPALSDFHLYAGNAAHEASLLSARYAGMGIRELAKRLPLDGVALLGDYSYQSADYTAEQVKRDITLAKEALGLEGSGQLWCVGNHDWNYGAGRDRTVTPDEQYSYIGANADGVKPYDSIQRCYGYRDFENQKLRVIFLNTCDTSDFGAVEGEPFPSEWISPTQLRWLIDTALNFTDKPDAAQWGIVVMGHHPLHYGYACFGQVMTLLEAYRDSTSGSVRAILNKDTDGSWVKETVAYDFTNGDKAEIICNIHGHNHNCGASKISSSSWSGAATPVAEPWLWRFCIPNLCANRYNESATSSNETFRNNFGEFDKSGNPVYWEKTPDTAQATSFCLVSVDRANKKVYAHSFGAGKDRVMDYGQEASAYTNQIPISTDMEGNTYNGTGYKTDIYLSSANEGSKAGYGATGFIPVPAHTDRKTLGAVVLHLKNVAALPTDAYVRVNVYDENKTLQQQIVASQGIAREEAVADANGDYKLQMYYTLGEDGYIATMDISGTCAYQASTANKGTTAYVRICAPGIDGDSILTVNEVIE